MIRLWELDNISSFAKPERVYVAPTRAERELEVVVSWGPLRSLPQCVDCLPYPIECLSDTGRCYRDTRRSRSLNRSASCPASRPYALRSRTGWQRPPSNCLSEFMFTLMVARMHNRAWRSFRGGLRTITTTIRSTRCE